MKRKVWKMSKKVFPYGFILSFILILTPILSTAQQYPTRPINILVGFGPGGACDIPTRVLGSKAEKFLGQPFVISNMAGGGGSVALGVITKERPDGYHLVACTSTGLNLTPQFRPVSYKPEDFVPIMHFGTPETGLVVKSSSPWKTMKEFVEYAKKNPGKITYGSSAGVGSTLHIVMEYVAKQEGIQWTHVPYAGSPPSIAALMGGHIDALSDAATWFPYVKEGTLRLLASHGEERMKSLPDAPTFRELGYDIFNDAVFMLAAPKGISSAVVKKLDEVFRKAMDDPEFIQTCEKIQIKVKYRGSEEIKKYIEEGYVRNGKLIRDLKIPKEGEKK